MAYGFHFECGVAVGWPLIGGVRPEPGSTLNNSHSLPRNADTRVGYVYCAVRTDVRGNRFNALYENFLETQVATLALRLRY